MVKYTELITELDKNRIEFRTDEMLAPYSTFKIGGPADILAKAKSREELIKLIELAVKTNTPYTILGWASNVLIKDKGIRGLVIKNVANAIDILEPGKVHVQIDNSTKIEPRLDEIDTEKFYSFEDLSYDESSAPKVRVRIESGASLPSSIMNLIRNGITGLQWFGGIPGTFGGAVYNNIHGGSHFLSEYIDTVEALDPTTLNTRHYTGDECNFGYDYSRFHDSKEVILSAVFNLFRGDAQKAKQVYIEWTKRKRVQPQKSAGCVWQNITEEQRKQLGLESTSWGYIIDQVLQLKGKRIGGAIISPKHAAFIENIGQAKAADVVALMDLIRKEAKAKLGIEPKPEIFLIGE